MVSSARNPNESYAQRAKKASTSSNTQQKRQHDKPTSHATSAPPSSLKPPQVNVWAERIKEQKANAGSAVSHMPRQRATSSPQPIRDDDAIQRRSSKSDLATQLAILDQQDEHDPFVVRVPPHLSRQSSSSTNPLPVTDPTAWPHLSAADSHSNPGHDSGPFLSAAPSRQNSITSFRHNAYSPSGSARLPRVQSTLSQHSHSASQSRSGSSASSPRLQIRVRPLPLDDDLRLDPLHQRSSHQRSSSPLSDPPFRVDPSLDPAYRPSPIPPLQDIHSRYAQPFLPQYAFPQQFKTTHAPGHHSPTYIPPHSGQATPPYSHYPPYPAYMYSHPSLYWGDYAPPHSHAHFQSQPPVPSNPLTASEHPRPRKADLGSASSAVTTESEDPPQPQHKPSKNVVFGTIGLSDSSSPATPPPVTEEQQANTVVEHVTEQFATFSIGVSPHEPGPSRLGSRKSSVRSLSRTVSAQPATNEGVKDLPTPSREVNGTNKPVKWEFGTTHSEDLNASQASAPPPPTSTSLPVPNHQGTSGPENADDQPEAVNTPSSPVTLRTNRAMDKSETGSPTSDVWVVKDYGYGFGDQSGLGNAPEVARLEMHEREKERVRDKQRERDMFRDHYHDRNWVPGRQPGWRHENGIEEGRDGWEQRGTIDVPRHMRPRRGSFPGYGGHERGGFTPRRGRAFGGRFQGGRGRGAFFHHRPGSYPYAPQPHPPPSPFEVLPPAIDIVNGYGQLPYIPPELESHKAIPPIPQPFVPNTYLAEAAQNCLLDQLEYYISPQNMVQDFYLRQRMDDEGWIPISLLASFKRVRQLHTDADVAREVLSRSRVVEVNGDWVRMGSRQWESFVLPNAPRSMVTGVDHEEGKNPAPSTYHDPDGDAEYGDVAEEHGEIEGDCEGEDCDGR
ncbi:hypothetical protein JVU11DRAFT_7822 [Chiua virens]|nr:hypothetical protein JVU11DRAFT_7822 [Chiua virens]